MIFNIKRFNVKCQNFVKCSNMAFYNQEEGIMRKALD